MIRSMLEIAPSHRYSLYPGFGDFYFDPRMAFTWGYAGGRVRPRHFTRAAAAAFWNRPDVEAALGQPDVVHANNFWCPTQLAASRLVYTCYDLGFLVEPAWTTEANRVGCFEGMFRSSIAADWVVAISEATRSHYLRTFPHFPPERVRVIHPASRFADARTPGRRPSRLVQSQAGRFWLSVGTIEPRKNQLRLAQAYARYLVLGGEPMPLVFAGGRGWLMEDFESRIAALGIAANVIFAGYVNDEELAWLYRNCYANLYPSLFEGFGLPVLEGMQFGAPCILSNASSLPEVAGDAARLVAPDDEEAWARAMLALANDRAARDGLAAASRAQAARFDRDASARRLLDLYGEAVREPKLHTARTAA
jgi:glycosyltransferase involved in cell wall biosynthesis